MKKLILVFAFFAAALLIIPAVTAVQCTSLQQLNQERLQVKAEFANYRAEQHMFGMDAVIEFAEEQGADTAEMEQLRNQFEEKNQELQAAAETGNQNQYQEILQEMKQIATQFREEARNQIAEGDMDQARDRMRQRLQEQDEHLGGLLETARTQAKTHTGARFEAHVCVAQNLMEQFKNKGGDLADLEDDLDAIKAKKADLLEKREAAITSCADIPYGQCDTDEKAEYEDAKDELIDEFTQLRTQFREKVQAHVHTGTGSDQGQGTSGSGSGQGGQQ